MELDVMAKLPLLGVLSVSQSSAASFLRLRFAPVRLRTKGQKSRQRAEMTSFTVGRPLCRSCMKLRLGHIAPEIVLVVI